METTNEKRAPLSSQVMEPQEMLKHLQAVMTKVRDHEAVAESHQEWGLAEGYAQEAAALEQAIKALEVLADPDFLMVERMQGLVNHPTLAKDSCSAVLFRGNGRPLVTHAATPLEAILGVHPLRHPSTPSPNEQEANHNA